MPRCPWHGSECACTENPFGPKPEHWFGAHMPERCEKLLPLYMVAAYLKPQQVSDETKKRYLDWVAGGKK